MTDHREAVARKLCEQRGCNPDAIGQWPHDSWDGPLWTAFTRDADDILALLRPASGSVEQCDRDAAYQYFNLCFRETYANDASSEPFLSGGLDDKPLVQAFARHRLNALKGGAYSTFAIGDRVEKVSGSSWRGLIVGTYSTTLTPEGYAVESERELGSVQIYPAKALRPLPAPPAETRDGA